MNDDAGIRRENLRKLGKSASELAGLGVGGYSYWAAMLAENSKKNFGEKAARQLEEKLNLPRGQLDQSEGRRLGANVTAPMGTLAATGGPAYAEQLDMLFKAIPVDKRLEAFNAVLPTLLGFLPVQTERTIPLPAPVENLKKLDA